jgi:transcriptional regulator with XRE-family HTH domain
MDVTLLADAEMWKRCHDAAGAGNAGNIWKVLMDTFGDTVRRLRGRMSLRELARRAFVDPGHLSRIEAGHRSPTADLAAALDTALNANGTLVSLATAHVKVAARRADHPDRLIPSVLPGNPRDARPNDLDAMMSFRTADSHLGGGYLYGTVAIYLHEKVAPRLFDVGQVVDQASLFAASAALTEMAGWMAHDAGRDQVAERHFHRALALARASQDSELGAHILGSLSHLAHHEGKSEAGLSYARQAWTLAGGSCHPAVAARLSALQARGHAALRQEKDAVHHLANAERALDREPAAAPSPWVSPFDRASLATEAARSFALLRQFNVARRQAEQVTQLRPTERTRSRAFANLMIASALIAEGKPAEACAMTGEILDATRNLSSYLVVQQLQRLDHRLAPHRSNPEIATFREQLRDELRGRAWITEWLPADHAQASRTVLT